jgi:hypothetical protein
LSLSGELLCSQEHRRKTPWLSSRITVCNALIAAVRHWRGLRKNRGRKTKRRHNAEPNAQQRLKHRPTMTRHKGERSMTAAESKGLKKGSRVYWRGDAADGGSITENKLGCSHDRLGQWSGGQSTPWGYARNPASAGKAGYCVGDAERRLVLDAGRCRSLSNSASILIARIPLHSWRTVKAMSNSKPCCALRASFRAGSGHGSFI